MRPENASLTWEEACDLVRVAARTREDIAVHACHILSALLQADDKLEGPKDLIDSTDEKGALR